MKISKKYIHKPEILPFHLVIEKNRELFTPDLNDQKIFNILKKLAIENFGELQFKKTLLEKTKITEIAFEEILLKEKIGRFKIDTFELYKVSDLSTLIFYSYHRKIKKGSYGIHTKK